MGKMSIRMKESHNCDIALRIFIQQTKEIDDSIFTVVEKIREF